MTKLKYILPFLIHFTLYCQPGFAQDDSLRFVDRLRSQLKHKFILEFVLKQKPEREYDSEELLRDWSKDSNNFEVIDPPLGKGALETFRYYHMYQLYRVLSFNGNEQYYALVYEDIGPQEIFLLSDDTTHPMLEDTFSIHGPGGTGLSFERLNNGNILRAFRSAPGVGYMLEQNALVGIIDGKFTILFKTNTLEVRDLSDDSNDTTALRTTSTYQFANLNSDSLSDIIEQISEDVILMDEMQSFTNFQTAKVIRHVSKRERRYLWNNKTYSFDPIE